MILKGKFSKDTRVREIMTEKVYFVRPERTIEECMAVMTAERIRHLPILTDDRLTGIVSIGDVVRVIISDKEFLIKQLEHYITGSRV